MANASAAIVIMPARAVQVFSSAQRCCSSNPLEHDDRAGAVSAAAGDSGSAGAATEAGPRI